jgi:hypothetical protein
MMITLTLQQMRMLRLQAQRLVLQPATGALPIEQILDEVCGVQAQDMPAARLAIHKRNSDLHLADIEQARQETGDIVHTWAMRGTLHLLSREDARWLVPFFAPTFIAGDRRRMVELGWDDERSLAGLKLVEKALVEQGSLTRLEIADLLKQNSLPSEGQAPVHLIYRAAWEMILVQGPDHGKKPCYVPFDTWVGKAEAVAPGEDVARLIRCYLQAYGPASPEDFAAWSGLRISEIRPVWQALKGNFATVEIEGRVAWMIPSRLEELDSLLTQAPIVRLLPRFDNYLLGYAYREMIIESQHAWRISSFGGIIPATLVVDGQILGIWQTRPVRQALEISLDPFHQIDANLADLIDKEAHDLGEFLGKKTVLKMKTKG